jgi:2-haloacid dehalogenase
MAGRRWVTFDCYGTLIDWNAGIGAVIGADRLQRYHELEPRVEADDPSRTYREVLTLTAERLGADGTALVDSLPSWPVFPEVPPALRELRARGWSTAILSNTDRDLIDASIAAVGVPFDEVVVASEIGSYKPGHGHWEAFRERTGRDPDVHVAASLFHDIRPGRELGLTTVWINRLGEEADPEPTRELPDLSRLPDVLEELVPA